MKAKQCSNCARWLKPLAESACNIGAYKPTTKHFKENDKGVLYCDDFKVKEND